MFGIVYVYRLCDFLAVAKAHGVRRIFLNSVFVKELHSDNSEGLSDGVFKWTDVHELGFMGAFGMGYKMLVNGETQACKVAHNELLWTNVGLLRRHIQECCSSGSRAYPKELSVSFGVVGGTEIPQQARVPWAVFMDNKIPKQVAVHDFTR